MDGENNGKPYEQMDDLGVFHLYFWFNTHLNSPMNPMFFQAWFYSLNFGPKTFVAWNVMELYTNNHQDGQLVNSHRSTNEKYGKISHWP